jgi:hypothetical protein
MRRPSSVSLPSSEHKIGKTLNPFTDMTDGVLLRESLVQRDLDKYSCIIMGMCAPCSLRLLYQY